MTENQRSAPFPNRLKGAPWTAEQRRAQAATLQQCFELEERAIGKIEEALAAIGK